MACSRKRRHVRGVGELGALDPVKERHERGLVEGEEGGEEHVEDDAAGPHVGGAAVVALQGWVDKWR